jgi:HD-like signal output (HDOD) protein
MKKWFARLFGGAGGARPDSRPSGPASGPTSGPTPAPAAAAIAEATPDIDLAFFLWLAGPHVSGAPSGAELVLDELARLGRDPLDAASLVPRVPAVIPQLLRSLRDQDSSSAELARQLAQDAVLVAEVIREVNSPYYRPATPVRNLEGALLLLGQNGLRMLLARVAFRPVISIQAGPLARQVAPNLWRQSEHCALAAALLAPRLGADPFEACLAGLMHNVGLVVALRVIDGLLPAGALPDDDAFGLGLVRVARRISARIATQWELPAPIGHAIAHLGDGVSLPAPLPATLAAADRLAKLRMLAGGGQPAFVRAAAQLPADERQVYDQLDDQPEPEER